MGTPFLSELSHSGRGDFAEICVPEGADVSRIQLVVYDKHGNVEKSFSLGSPNATSYGMDVYLLDRDNTQADDSKGKGDKFAIKNHDAVALVADGTVLQFVSFKDDVSAKEGPAADMTSDVIGYAGKGASLQSDDLGVTYYEQSPPTPGTLTGPVCFTPGTLIATPFGLAAVEELREDDLVLTEDSGPQPILWMHQWSHEFGREPDPFKPILISEGSLPCGGPARSLTVSPQHRVLIRGRIVEQMFGVEAVFAPAKALTPIPGIRWRNGTRRIEYIALMLSRHSVLKAEDTCVESFFPGPVAIQSMGQEARSRLFDRFPSLEADPRSYGQFARPALSVKHARQLAQAIRDCCDAGQRVCLDMNSP